MKRFGYENEDLPTWSKLGMTLWRKLKGEKQISKFVEVAEKLPCGCPNPAWDKAQFEGILIAGKNPFNILKGR